MGGGVVWLREAATGSDVVVVVVVQEEDMYMVMVDYD